MIEQLKHVDEILKSFKEQHLINDYALIGGVALAIWDVPRFTQDIDLLVTVESDKRTDLLEAFKIYDPAAKLTESGPQDPIPYMIDVTIDGVEVDIICVSKTWELESVDTAKKVVIDNNSISVINLHYLIILKLKANGPQDRLDVQNILKHHKDDIDMNALTRIADKFKVSNRLNQLTAVKFHRR